jgi:hypothetical protein
VHVIIVVAVPWWYDDLALLIIYTWRCRRIIGIKRDRRAQPLDGVNRKPPNRQTNVRSRKRRNLSEGFGPESSLGVPRSVSLRSLKAMIENSENICESVSLVVNESFREKEERETGLEAFPKA